MPDIPTLTDWPTSGVVIPRGAHLQQGVDAIRALADAEGYDQRGHNRPQLGFRWIGVIYTKGPNGESDYTDERYFVKRQSLDAGDVGDGTDGIDFSDDTTFDPNIYTVTNLPEWTGQYHLLKGYQDPVEVSGWNDDSGQSRWTMSVPVPSVFRVALTSTSGAAGTQTTASSWVYTVSTLAGLQLATGLSPERPRRNGALAAATKGYAYFDTTGTLVLAEAWEGTSTGHC